MKPTELQIDPSPLADWSAPTKFCPFCGKENIICLNTWGISSTEEKDNTGEATEYQCRADCGGRSFWT